jgi:hypothetical protein
MKMFRILKLFSVENLQLSMRKRLNKMCGGKNVPFQPVILQQEGGHRYDETIQNLGGT